MNDEEPYSNRELREIFGGVKKDLEEIKEQTTKTNGRVRNLEKWQSFMKGGLAVCTSLLIPILIYLITSTISITPAP